jgi:P-type Ca2+ transporter type 2C
MNWHLLPISEISKLLNTSPSGIDTISTAQRLEEYGKNQITDKKKKTVFQMMLHQITDFMILILIAADRYGA